MWADAGSRTALDTERGRSDEGVDRVIVRWRGLGRTARGAVVAATLVAFVIVATGLIALVTARPALAASSTLTVLDGIVSVRDGAGDFTAAADGQLITAGTTVRTGPGAYAVLTYIDGSTVTIEPDTEVVVEQLEVSGDGDLVVRMSQAIGRAWHVVAHKLGPTGRYEVRTPAATAAVRGTAFTTGVRADGTLDLETTEGVVAATGGGDTVEVTPGQATSVAVDSRPAAPVAAPVPQTVVRIVLEPTANAVAVDRSGRSVGVQGGQPIRYIPGSRVELVGGQLVLTIPTNEPGRISTVVRPAAGATAPVAIQTQVVANGDVVATTVESRRPDDTGTARGGVVLTATGVVVLPDSEAARFSAPIIGRLPERPARQAPTPRPLVTARASGSAAPAGGDAPGAAPFPGGFQPFGAGAAPGSLVRFTGEVPAGLLPPPPPAKEGCAAFAQECAGVRRSTVEATGRPQPAAGGPVFTPRVAAGTAAPAAEASPRTAPAATARPGFVPPPLPLVTPVFATTAPRVTPRPTATPAPTAPATRAPLETPAPLASAIPSATLAPRAGATVAPVASPTILPVIAPSASPTAAPETRTTAPTASPSPSPSPSATKEATATPTPAPTATPCPSGTIGLPGTCVGGLGSP